MTQADGDLSTMAPVLGWPLVPEFHFIMHGEKCLSFCCLYLEEAIKLFYFSNVVDLKGDGEL